MASAFEIATRSAIEELIQNHAQPSKFGFMLTHDGYRELVGELFELLQTSRSLKAVGDRMLAGGPVALGGAKAPPRNRR
jgi:putative AlgH/UPF0301 family transcriptional regulator